MQNSSVANKTQTFPFLKKQSIQQSEEQECSYEITSASGFGSEQHLIFY